MLKLLSLTGCDECVSPGASDKANDVFDDTEQSPFNEVHPDKHRKDLLDSLVRKLNRPKLAGAAKILCHLLSVTTIEDAALRLLPRPPTLQPVRIWTHVTARYKQESKLEKFSFTREWDYFEAVHLELLKTLISWPAIKEAVETHDKLLFIIAVEHDARNRPIEVLVARLDGNRNVEFLQDRSDRAVRLARPLYQLDAGDDSFSCVSIPETRIAVERLGQRLLVCFDEEMPEQLEDRHWKKLNAALGESRYGNRPYYFVIPNGHPVYSQASVRTELRRYLPNLPRILIDEELGTTPFVCDPVELDEAIKAFYRMKPDQEKIDENKPLRS